MKQTVRWRGGWARLGPWRGRRNGVAQLALGSDSPPSPETVDRCLTLLRRAGYEAVVTNAMSPAESLPFVDAGFAVRERLHLLAHEMGRLPDPGGRTRRARRADREAVLRLDALAFDAWWRLGSPSALDDAVHATPLMRFRVADRRDRAGSRPLAGYAITGVGARQGYLQRLAVDPAERGRGRGRSLVADALHWLRRRGVTRTLVNTQLDNEAALSLYRSCGFRPLPVGLCVLGRSL